MDLQEQEIRAFCVVSNQERGQVMNLKIGRYTVDVTAQADGEDKTAVFLNEVMLGFFRVADDHRANGRDNLAREAVDVGMDIYKALDAVGHYDGVK